MKTLKTVRFDEAAIKLIDKFKGRNFSDKLNNIIRYSTSEALKKEQKEIILRVKCERQELARYQKDLLKLKTAVQTVIHRFKL